MKKFVSVFLSLLMVLSSITCLLFQNVSAAGEDVDIDGSGIVAYTREVAVESNSNDVKGGYITKDGDKYTAVSYDFSEFDGWYNQAGNLITKEATVTVPENGGYYGARFKTGNLIKDSGFENYETGSVIYNHQSSEKQIWTTYYMDEPRPLTQFGSSFADGTYAYSGKNSMKMSPPWQRVGTDVTLEPNTTYLISIKYAYTTAHATTYLSFLNYGLYVPNTNTNAIQAMGSGSALQIEPKNTISPSTWYSTEFYYTTGDTVPTNAMFGYKFGVGNDDESVSTSTENNTQLYLDDILVIPMEKYNITLDAKNTSTIVPVDNETDFAFANKDYSFKVITEPGLTPTVSANGTPLTPDESGVYCFIPTADTVIKIDCGEADEGRPESGKDYEGRDLTKYNSDVYLENIWEGDTVYQETALFVTGRETVQLLYPVDEVISLRSYGLETTYIEGVDFEVTNDGLIKILEGSRIPVYSGELTTTVKPDKNAFPLKDDPNTYIKSIGDTTYPKYAISVTYKHSKTFEDGYQPIAAVPQDKKLNNTLAKLEAGEEVNIVIYGDSISCGWSSSGMLNEEIYAEDNKSLVGGYTINVAPYAPTWIEMVTEELKERYPNATINVKNLSLGGKSSLWGAQNIQTRLALWKDENGDQVIPDLIMVGFGVNDRHGNYPAASFKSSMKAIVDNARSASGNEDMEVLYYSAMLPNQKATVWTKELMLEYESALEELANADENIGVMKLTSIYDQIIKSKDPLDYLNTNWNHGNDFTARMYATGILAALNISPTADAPTTATVSYNSVTLTGIEGYEYSLDGEKWQTSNLFSGLEAKTEYTFYQRVAETNGGTAGTISEALTLTTTEKPAFTPGNVDGDEKNEVNLNDVVTLAQYVAGWQDVDYVEAALDINGDGDVDLNDVVQLAQHVAGWDGAEPSDKPYSPKK